MVCMQISSSTSGCYCLYSSASQLHLLKFLRLQNFALEVTQLKPRKRKQSKMHVKVARHFARRRSSRKRSGLLNEIIRIGCLTTCNFGRAPNNLIVVQHCSDSLALRARSVSRVDRQRRLLWVFRLAWSESCIRHLNKGGERQSSFLAIGFLGKGDTTACLGCRTTSWGLRMSPEASTGSTLSVGGPSSLPSLVS